MDHHGSRSRRNHNSFAGGVLSQTYLQRGCTGTRAACLVSGRRCMSTTPHTTVIAKPSHRSADNDLTSHLLRAASGPHSLIGDRLLTAQAMSLLLHLDRDLREARVQANQDWFRRLMRVRPK